MWVYSGSIWLDGSTYCFGQNLSDRTYLRIGGQKVLEDASWNNVTTNFVAFPAGWYDFELRTGCNNSDNLGASWGGSWGEKFGFGYARGVPASLANENFSFPENSAEETFFRYNDGIPWEGTLFVQCNPPNVPIASAEISPSAYDAHTGYEVGAQIVCSAPATWTRADGFVSASCVGCVVSNYSFVNNNDLWEYVGGSTENSIVYTQPAGKTTMGVLTWQWNVRSKVLFAADFGGSVSVLQGANGEFNDYGAEIKSAAIPEEGYVFAGWYCDEGFSLPEGTTAADNPITFRALTPVKLTARFISAAESSTLYVAPGGDDNSSGLTWDFSLATISAAIAKLPGGGEIIISNGVYEVRATMTVTAPLTIRSLSGEPEDVVICNPTKTAYQNLFVINHPDALLTGVVLSGARYTGGDTIGQNARVTAGVVSNCVIRNAYASHWQACGGIGIDGARGVVTHCVITNNFGGSWHGGWGLCLTAAGRAENCFIGGNSGSLTVGNCGGGASAVANGARIINCTIVNNRGQHEGGVHTSSGAIVANCVIASNTVTNTKKSETAEVWHGAGTFTNCLSNSDVIMQAAGGNNHFAADLVFADPKVDNWRLLATSPGINVGDNALATEASDLDGNKRISGGTIDIGCYELDTESTLTISYERTTAADFSPLAAMHGYGGRTPFTVTFTPAALSASGRVTYTWDFGDDSESAVTFSDAENGGAITHTFTKLGDHNVTLSAADSENTEGTFTHPICVSVYPREMFVLATPSENHVAQFPYDTWENAAENLQTAIDAGDCGSVINLARGIHTIDATITVNTAVKVRGASDNPAETVLDNTNKRAYPRNMIFLNNSGATFENVAISGARNAGGETMGIPGTAIYTTELGGSLSNCIIRNVLTTHWNDAAAAAYMGAGLITHCVISNIVGGGSDNFATFGATATALYLAGGARAENCLVTDVRNVASSIGADSSACAICAESGAAVINCTVAETQGRNNAGINGRAGATVANCLMANNVAQNAGRTPANSIFHGTLESFSNCAAVMDDAEDAEIFQNAGWIVAPFEEFRFNGFHNKHTSPHPIAMGNNQRFRGAR